MFQINRPKALTRPIHRPAALQYEHAGTAVVFDANDGDAADAAADDRWTAGTQRLLD